MALGVRLGMTGTTMATYQDVSIEIRSVMSGDKFQTTKQYTLRDVTKCVVVDDCNVNMTTYLTWLERIKCGNNSNEHVGNTVLSAC